jgi:hypothetical protein
MPLASNPTQGIEKDKKVYLLMRKVETMEY